MELGGFGFEKSELMKLAEDIYELKSKKQDLELTLHSEQFHYKYIPQRKSLAEHEVTFRLLWIIPITIAVLAALCYIIYYVFDMGGVGREGAAASAMGVGFLGTTILAAFGGYVAFKLWKREIHMITLLWLSKNPDKAEDFSRKYGINTFQYDESITKQRIAMLEEEISSIAIKIKQLEERQKELLEEKRRGDDFLRNKGVLFDEKPEQLKGNGKFVLRKESVGSGDIRDLYEYYSKEEQYVQQRLIRLDGEIGQLDKQIVQIDDDFEQVKKIILFFLICYILVIVIQAAFSGLLGSFTAILCMIVSLIIIFALERKCTRPILLYLVEHDSSMVQEYAFRNSMVPVYVRKEELLETKQYLLKELEDIKKSKQGIDL